CLDWRRVLGNQRRGVAGRRYRNRDATVLLRGLDTEVPAGVPLLHRASPRARRSRLRRDPLCGAAADAARGRSCDVRTAAADGALLRSRLPPANASGIAASLAQSLTPAKHWPWRFAVIVRSCVCSSLMSHVLRISHIC